MGGIQLFQPGGAGVLNAAGAQHPSPVNVEVALLCQLSPVGITSATWRWFLTKPAGSASVLSSTTSGGPSFMPDIEGGSYSISLFDIDENEYILDIVTPTTGGGGGGGGGTVVTTVDDYDSVRSAATFTGVPPAVIIVQSRETVDDGGGGLFAFDSGDTSTADNDGTVLVGAAGYRFKRIFSGAIDVRWFGASDAAVDNTAAIQAALTFGGHIYIPEGTYNFASRLVVSTGTHIEGAGKYSILNYEGAGTAIRHENPTGTTTAQMVWANFALHGGASAKIGVELVNAYAVTLSNIDIDGGGTGFDDAGIRVTCEFGAFNSALINICDGTNVHECAGDGIQVYYPPAKTMTLDAGLNIVNCTAHGKLEGDLALFATDGSLAGTGITDGVQDFYYVRNPTTNNFQISLTPTGALVDITGTGTGPHRLVGPGAPVSGLNVLGCLISQCLNGINCDAGTVGTAGQVAITDTILQSNSRCQITGSFLRGEISNCHMEQGGPALTAGAHIVLGTDQQIYSLRIEGNLISGGVAGQDYSIDISPTGAVCRNLTIVSNFMNRASQYNIRVSTVQGVDIGVNYYGNYQVGPVIFADCTCVRFQDADLCMDTMSTRRVITDNYTAGLLDELIQVNALAKTVTLPSGNAFSLYGGKRYTIYNLLDTTTTIDFTSTDAAQGSGGYSLVGQYSAITFVAVTPDDGATFQWVVQSSSSLFSRTLHGSGTPEGAVTAPVGMRFVRTDGGSSTLLYLKVSGTGDTGWEAVVTEVHELAMTRISRGHPAFGTPTLWSIDQYGRAVCGTTAGDFAYYALELPDGAQLTDVELTVIGGGNVNLPGVMPRFRVRRVSMADNSVSASSDAVDGSASVGVYNALHTITLSSLSYSVNQSFKFIVEFDSESGANAVVGFTIIGVKATFTVFGPGDRGAG